MLKVSDFVYREVINISDGEKIGYVSDIEFNRETGFINSIIIPEKTKRIFSSKSQGIKIPWDNIKKIGDDIILVDIIAEKYY